MDALPVRDVLLAVATRRGAELSAHETMRNEWTRASSIERLVQEHRTLVAAAVVERWEPVIERCRLDAEELTRARNSLEWPALLSALHDADNRGLRPEAVIGSLATSRPIGPEEDPAAVLRARLHRWEGTTGHMWSQRATVAGVVPLAQGISNPDMARAIRDRENAIVNRARALAEDALDRGAAWTRDLGPRPEDPRLRAAFTKRVAVIAAYRDRWSVDVQTPLDARAVGAPERMAHHNRAQRARTEATSLAGATPDAASSPETCFSDGPTANICPSPPDSQMSPEATTFRL